MCFCSESLFYLVFPYISLKVQTETVHLGHVEGRRASLAWVWTGGPRGAVRCDAELVSGGCRQSLHFLYL